MAGNSTSCSWSWDSASIARSRSCCCGLSSHGSGFASFCDGCILIPRATPTKTFSVHRGRATSTSKKSICSKRGQVSARSNMNSAASGPSSELPARLRSHRLRPQRPLTPICPTISLTTHFWSSPWRRRRSNWTNYGDQPIGTRAWRLAGRSMRPWQDSRPSSPRSSSRPGG